MARILLIDDDPAGRRGLGRALRQDGHDVRHAGTAEAAIDLVRRDRPDLVISEWTLADGTGDELCAALARDAATRHVPFVFVTDRGEEIFRIRAFEAGAVDYVVKPFSVRELLLRLRAVLRRAQGQREQPGVDRGLLRIDRAGHRVWVEGREVSLTRIEYSLLTALVDQEDRALTRAKLLDRVWGDNVNVTDRTVDTHVTRLRTKLGAAGRYVQTVRGHGYRFSISDRPGPGALAQT